MNEEYYKITITPIALEKAKEQIQKREPNPAGIRLGLRAGKCEGYEIVFEFADKITENDLMFVFDSVSIYVDPKSIVFLSGTEIDYKYGLMQHGFKFNIPQQEHACSCGSSISFK